jgi:transcriptional regulator with XRE-family HTH domain
MTRVAEVFGRNLRRERESLGISQEELAERSERHRTEISQLERGLRIARIDTLVRLAGSLDVNPNDLLIGLKWKPGARIRGRFD